ncbi:hypothetical protein TrVE_jg4659 [Triparma verrucosa]|uniref:Uncharacterized protein n=1 Tax=Triparma verrucosa TaxID=1606542 RepID=A0A9W7C8J6_9STRA|nr:hypothetical protein TrVE_jg4659 [Triparma verrucosa]
MLRTLLLLSLIIAPVYGQADGNPHQWDRLRRCDHTDYDPPCGPCEGIGGIPTGDDNDAITLTSCSIVANASDVPEPVAPVWGEQWVVDPYYEVLIGKKTDPFCFSVIPSNDSVGELCYRPDYGAQYYDVGGESGALRFDLNSKTVVGNITSKILHQDTNFWIVNKFPWYALGVSQCICSQVREGGQAGNKLMSPVNPDWTKQMFYIGRETIGIEYTGTEQTLDHWAFGPHHLWSTPDKGEIIRMWQPFNGLQIFPEGTNRVPQDQSLFESPPPECKKEGGALFRIKCTDEGYPQSEEEMKASVSKADKMRAEEPVPRDQYKGNDFNHMSNVLNGWLQDGAAETRACDEWSVEELQQLQAMLYLARESSFDDIYQSVEDNRRMRKDFSDIERDWDQLTAIMDGVDSDHVAHKIRRDGHCHEAVMWFVHHLTEDVKQLMADAGVVIPLLSLAPHHAPSEDSHAAHHAAYNVYQEQVTCSSCHAAY